MFTFAPGNWGIEDKLVNILKGLILVSVARTPLSGLLFRV